MSSRSSCQVKNLPIHLYFIATNNLQDNALVEFIDNWTLSYSLRNNIEKPSKIIFKRFLVLAGNLKVGKQMLCCFYFQIQHRCLYKKQLLKYRYANFLKKIKNV